MQAVVRFAVCDAVLDDAEPVAECDPLADPHRRIHRQVRRPQRAMDHRDDTAPADSAGVAHPAGSGGVHRLTGPRREIDPAVA